MAPSADRRCTRCERSSGHARERPKRPGTTCVGRPTVGSTGRHPCPVSGCGSAERCLRISGNGDRGRLPPSAGSRPRPAHATSERRDGSEDDGQPYQPHPVVGGPARAVRRHRGFGRRFGRKGATRSVHRDLAVIRQRRTEQDLPRVRAGRQQRDGRLCHGTADEVPAGGRNELEAGAPTTASEGPVLRAGRIEVDVG